MINKKLCPKRHTLAEHGGNEVKYVTIMTQIGLVSPLIDACSQESLDETHLTVRLQLSILCISVCSLKE